MIKDTNGVKVSPRQKAAEVLLARMNADLDLESDPSSRDMTEREKTLVATQIEKLHEKQKRMLTKARHEEKGKDSSEE